MPVIALGELKTRSLPVFYNLLPVGDCTREPLSIFGVCVLSLTDVLMTDLGDQTNPFLGSLQNFPHNSAELNMPKHCPPLRPHSRWGCGRSCSRARM